MCIQGDPESLEVRKEMVSVPLITQTLLRNKKCSQLYIV